LRHVAEKFHLAASSLCRHRKKHLSTKLALARNKEILSTENALDELKELKARLWAGMDAACMAGSGAAMVALSREVRELVVAIVDLAERMATAGAASSEKLSPREFAAAIREVYGLAPYGGQAEDERKAD
jgi:hypothetical protein